MKVELKLNNGTTKVIDRVELSLHMAVNKFEEVKIIGYKMIKNIK